MPYHFLWEAVDFIIGFWHAGTLLVVDWQPGQKKKKKEKERKKEICSQVHEFIKR